jgi:hypothetical protein
MLKSQAQVPRAPRVKLVGTVLVLIRLENGRQFTAKLHQLSVTGGLVHLERPLDEGIKVEVIFHIASHTVRNRAAMLFPMWATNGCLQPFAFVDLTEENRLRLEAHVEQLLEPGKPATPAQDLSGNLVEGHAASSEITAPPLDAETPSS